MFKKIFEKFLSKTAQTGALFQNRMFYGQDLLYAKGMCKAINDLPKDFNYQKTRFHFEHIFLCLSDRTLAHPDPGIIPKTIENRSMLDKKIDELLGSEGKDIDWVSDDTFDLDSINNSEWFHSKIDSYPDAKEALEKAKENYIKSKIDINDFYEIRMKYYNDINPGDHLKYFEGIKLDIYMKEIKAIFEDKVSGIV